MLHQLLESGAPAPRRGRWAFTSGLVHAALIAGAVALTMREVPPDARPLIEYVNLPALPGPRPIQRPLAPPVTSAPASLTIVDAARIDFPTVTPVGLPEPSARLSDPTDFVGSRIVGPAGPVRPVTTEIHTRSTVDRAVIPRRDNPTPDYPVAMRAASVEGSVLVQFVVDTTGRVEPSSIAILKATHPQFGDAVRRWLGRTRYSAAELEGTRVRQLVQQEVGFTLQR